MINKLKVISYNVQGLRNAQKRRKMFCHIHVLNTDVVVLQETHSDKKTEKIWKSEWGGPACFSHGDTNARGVAILFKRNINCKILKQARDNEGRVLAVKIQTVGPIITLLAIYAPNSDSPQFFVNAFSIAESLENDLKIIAGDFNTVLDISKDLQGGKGHSNVKTRQFLNEYLSDSDLVDVWRIHHPDDFRSSYISRKPVLLQERIDFFLVSSALVQNVLFSDILPMFISDHALPVIDILLTDSAPGRGYWKLNL